MSINGITSKYPAGYEVKRTMKNTFGKDFDSTSLVRTGYIKDFTNTTTQASVLDIYGSMCKFGRNISRAAETKVGVENASDWEDWLKESGQKHERVLSDEETEPIKEQESNAKTEIVVQPDGSRVLVMTMEVGGMETTVSLEISKPTKAQNDYSKQDTTDDMSAIEKADMSDEAFSIVS